MKRVGKHRFDGLYEAFSSPEIGCYAANFIRDALGVKPKDCVIQTDNGAEFTSTWNSGKHSAFEKWVDAYFAGYSNIPPGASTYQSDVETFHRLIEDEFYRIEHVGSFMEFFKKAATYILWFNWARRNRYKGGSPVEV